MGVGLVSADDELGHLFPHLLTRRAAAAQAAGPARPTQRWDCTYFGVPTASLAGPGQSARVLAGYGRPFRAEPELPYSEVAGLPTRGRSAGEPPWGIELRPTHYERVTMRCYRGRDATDVAVRGV